MDSTSDTPQGSPTVTLESRPVSSTPSPATPQSVPVTAQASATQGNGAAGPSTRPVAAARAAGQARQTQPGRHAGSSSGGRRWSSVELNVLIGLKRQEYERSLHDHPRERMRTADQKWADIEAGYKRHNFNRKADVLKKKWEKLMTDFKKVYDYQRQIPSGQVGY